MKSLQASASILYGITQPTVECISTLQNAFEKMHPNIIAMNITCVFHSIFSYKVFVVNIYFSFTLITHLIIFYLALTGFPLTGWKPLGTLKSYLQAKQAKHLGRQERSEKCSSTNINFCLILSLAILSRKKYRVNKEAH